MTPKELLRFAKEINPNKFEEDPETAIKDAYVIWEAVRLAELEKVSAPPAKAQATLYEPKRTTRRQSQKPELTTLDHLRIYMKREKLTANTMAEKLKLGSTSGIYHWLRGKYKPNANSIAKIEGFLHDVGYYE